MRPNTKTVQLPIIELTVDKNNAPTITIIKRSANGGTHTLWLNPKPKKFWNDLANLTFIVAPEPDEPQTPSRRDSWAPGSVLGTPKKLQPHPDDLWDRAVGEGNVDSLSSSEGTISGSDMESTSGDETDVEMSEGEEEAYYNALEDSCRKEASELSRHPTTIIRPGSYVPPERPLPWNHPNYQANQLRRQSTEIII